MTITQVRPIAAQKMHMADFTHPIWGWFILASTLISIAALLLFALKNAGAKKKKGEAAKSMGHLWDEDLHELNNPLPRWWLYLFYLTLFWGALYLLLYPGLGIFAGYLGWSQEQQYAEEIQQANVRYGPIYAQYADTPVTALIQDEQAVLIGKRLFATYCTTCHGSDARGARGYPNLRDDDWSWGGMPEHIIASITHGRQGIMPPWGDVLGEQGVFDVAEYVRTLGGLSADTQVAARGKALYHQYCQVCHGIDGRGDQAIGAPNLADDIWLYGGSQKKIMEVIALGKSGNMPAHKEFLGEAKIHLLATYLYSLSAAEAAAE